jgi:MFS family permease
MLLVYSHTLGLGTDTLEAMFGVYALGLISGLLLAGPFSDARGRRAVVVPAVVLSLLASLVLVLGADIVALLFLGRFLAGVSSGIVFAAGTAWLRETSLPPIGTASPGAAARRAAMAMTVGFGLGPLVAGLLAQWAPAPMVTPFLPHIALMAIVLVVLRNAPETVAQGARHRVRLSVPGVRSRRFLGVVAPMAPWVFAAPAIAVALLPNVVGANHAADGIALVATVAGALRALGGSNPTARTTPRQPQPEQSRRDRRTNAAHGRPGAQRSRRTVPADLAAVALRHRPRLRLRTVPQRRACRGAAPR